MKIGKWSVIGLAVVALYAGGKHAGATGGPIATMDVIHGAAHGGSDASGSEESQACSLVRVS